MKGPNYFKPNLKKFSSMMKENLYWILLGIAVGIVLYMVDKYIF